MNKRQRKKVKVKSWVKPKNLWYWTHDSIKHIVFCSKTKTCYEICEKAHGGWIILNAKDTINEVKEHIIHDYIKYIGFLKLDYKSSFKQRIKKSFVYRSKESLTLLDDYPIWFK